MEKIMNCQNLRKFAYVNDEICKKPIKGIVLSFFGLGVAEMYSTDTEEGRFYAEKGILYVVPYNNPWAWMNKQAVSYTDEIIDVLIEKHELNENIPIVSTGGSMGGQSALVYMVYAKHTPAACVANCPVCDSVFHFTERDDLPRTMYSALYNESGDIETALKSISPLHLVEKMPKSQYHVFHCDHDMAVNINSHSDKFVFEMKKNNYDITYDIVPDRGHCDLTEEMRQLYMKYAVDAIEMEK